MKNGFLRTSLCIFGGDGKRCQLPSGVEHNEEYNIAFIH